ncbi:hypothetical protein E3N88_34553 [Mikania micrantha]|uniref:Leucine-rich repeat-containing N-terminal plant-type domain-containing protein n=1 Tax=Mikania micrantha TaxID=192012 RepID=A0A5N6M134_9ASTR|nr:hypothetical protein E3N88_34553 [Mikania micrantha]
MEKSVDVFMLILLLHVLGFTLATKFSSLINADECSMLFQFKENMSINNHASSDSRAYPKTASWNLNRSEGARNCCLWDGVECRSGHVIGLDLSSSFLYGPIYYNNSLFNLIHLRTLNLADNDFRLSQIPSGIDRFERLENLNLSYSFFSGEVPKQISHLRNIVSLDLTGNPLKLQSSDFLNLVQNSSENLKELFLSEVNIGSEIPNILVNSSVLTSLVMRNCGLGGNFPTDILNLKTLQVIDVQGNHNLTGYIPDFYGDSDLKHLIVADTNFQGYLPDSIGNLTHLNKLNLSSCAFTGTLPRSISNLTELTVLDLGYNYFSGPVPPFSSLLKLNYLNLAFIGFNRSNNCDWLNKFTNLSYLDLRYTNLNCEIPSSIGNQTQLTDVYFNGNHMIGKLPSSLMNLTHLKALDLFGNQLTGSLHSLESLSKLTYLSLSGNNFQKWKLPDWFGKLNKITRLDLSDVHLEGEIPSSFFNLTQVQVLDLSTNQLEGQLPRSLMNLQNLESFLLLDNNISGVVDLDHLLSLKKLKYLYLGGNRITLSVTGSQTNETRPKFIALDMSSCNLKVFPEFLKFQDQLLELYLDNNKIGGLIPGWMWNISKDTLTRLSLTENLLTGFEQHSPVAHWVRLQILDLSHNMLQGLIPVLPPSAKYFIASNNSLTGEFPSSICNSPSLELLDLSFNNITGSIPPCLEKLSNSLIVLNVRSNNLQGAIPNICNNESKLQMISLSDNKLEGQVPRSLENCESLQILDLGYNLIEGMFPFWLGTLSDLQVLILRFNKLHGVIRIPSKINANFPKLRIIDLSYNSFSGDLPHQYFQEWSAMKEAETNIATYMQTGINIIQEYDHTVSYAWVGNYSFSIQMTNKGVKREYEKILNIFYAVDLSSNKFSGTIPESTQTLINLQLLSLSNNELYGVIPPSMGKLTNLESLDLSSNKISGMIPQELVKLKFLAFFNVSYNHLTGPIPQGSQFYTFLNNSYMGNQALCGDPLSINCGDSRTSTPFEEDMIKSDFPNGIDWIVILTGVASGLVIGLILGNHLTTRWFLVRFRK